MTKEHFSLGPVPTAEECLQLGTDNYDVLARAECKRYATLLRRLCAEKWAADDLEGVVIKVTQNQHDFGTYFDVVVEFDSDDHRAVEIAIWIEHNLPEEWPAKSVRGGH